MSINRDIAAIRNISAVPTILKAMAELTGMRVGLVARVTSDSWTACAVYDQMEFGLAVGDQLDVATTLCKEVCGPPLPAEMMANLFAPFHRTEKG